MKAIPLLRKAPYVKERFELEVYEIGYMHEIVDLKERKKGKDILEHLSDALADPKVTDAIAIGCLEVAADVVAKKR